MKEKDLTKKELKATANELSKAMDFEESIETGEKSTIEGLKTDLIEAAKELREDDKISEKSKEVLVLLNAELPWKFEKKEEKPEIAKAKKKDIKKPVKKKETVKKESAKSENGKDEFGFFLKSKNSLFASAIKKNPMTMSEIKKEKWNDKGGSHYSTWKALMEMGAGQKTEDGKMSIKKNWKK